MRLLKVGRAAICSRGFRNHLRYAVSNLIHNIRGDFINSRSKFHPSSLINIYTKSPLVNIGCFCDGCDVC